MQRRDVKLASVLTVLLVGVSCFSQAMANEEKYLNSDPINIDGYMTAAPVATDSELENVKGELRKQKSAIVINKEKKKKYNELSRSTEKLSDVTEEMIDERKESKETIDKFNKKIDCLMAEGQKEGCEEYVKAPREDKIKLVQAAPVVEAEPIKQDTANDFGGQFKVLPYSGLTSLMSDNETLEAGSVLGLKVETNVSSRFSVGMGFKYTSLSTSDFGSNNYMDRNYLPVYNDFYNSGREVEYKNLNFDIYSKYFFVENSKFRPYVGAGLGYNRSTLKYTNNSSASNSNYGGGYGGCGMYGNCNSYGYSFGDEEVTSSSVNMELMIGSEILFTKSFGANLEINYTTALGGNLSSENGINAYKAPDQQRLEDLSKELDDAHVVSMFAGVLFNF